MTLKGIKVRYDNNYYAVFNTVFDGANIPVVMNWEDFNILKKIKKSWRCSNNGFISCSHTHNNDTMEIFLHEIVMGLINKKNIQKGGASILHINKIGLDNRRENLRYNIKFNTNRNQKKKKRTIHLPPSAGIKTQEIPTFVWYLKPNGTHGERFCVKIGDIKWKTTSSKKLSLRYKLEEAKEFLRKLKIQQPEIFSSHCMNGEYTNEGKQLLKSFYDIVQTAGYSITLNTTENKTDQYLKPGVIKSIKEQKLLGEQNIDFTNKTKKRRVINNLPIDSGITSNDLPAYCYYKPSYNSRGDYFVVENHPKQHKKTWQTTSSKFISIHDKYQQLLDYIKNLN